jgi:hypothetical protein
MVSNIILEKNAVMKYSEQHYHSESGGTYVNPTIINILDDSGLASSSQASSYTIQEGI